MKCLVTGGAGFVGSNLVDELIKQVEFIDDSNVHKVIDSKDINISNELYRKYKEIKKQHKKAMKLDSRGKRLSQE